MNALLSVKPQIYGCQLQLPSSPFGSLSVTRCATVRQTRSMAEQARKGQEVLDRRVMMQAPYTGQCSHILNDHMRHLPKNYKYVAN